MRLLKVNFKTVGPKYTDELERIDFHSWWPMESAEIVDGLCGYDISAGWSIWRCGNPEPCPEHVNKRCWCGKQAKYACSYAGQLVCGAPLCEEHRHHCRTHGGG